MQLSAYPAFETGVKERIMLLGAGSHNFVGKPTMLAVEHRQHNDAHGNTERQPHPQISWNLITDHCFFSCDQVFSIYAMTSVSLAKISDVYFRTERQKIRDPCSFSIYGLRTANMGQLLNQSSLRDRKSGIRAVFLYMG